MDIVSLLIIITALFIGLNIGANSASNAIGVVVGSNTMSFRKAAILTSVFMLSGALLQGGAVIDTVGRELVPTTGCVGDVNCSSGEISYMVYDKNLVLSALLSALIFLSVATFFSIPVATSHTIIGAILGVLVVMGLSNRLDEYLIIKLILSWVLTPIVAVVFAILIYKYLMTPLTQRLNLLTFNRVFSILLIIGSMFLSYSIGANNIGNVVGPVIGSNTMSNRIVLIIIIGAAMGLGANAFSRRVTETVGKKITSLGPIMAFTSQFAAALVIYFSTLLGLPISSTQAVVGGVIGVGLTKGIQTVNIKTIGYIFIGWVLTPITAGMFSILIYWFLSRV